MNRQNQSEGNNSHMQMESADADEIKLSEVSKHSFGIIMLYVYAFVGIILGLGLSYFLLPTVISDTTTAFAYANLFAVVTILLGILMVTLATVVYRQNRLIITDRNITQVLQLSLFSRKVSQLNMVNVEDVTSEQNGLFATLFGYGTLTIETAGEQANFKFIFCPRPNYYAKVILEAREKVLGQHDGNHQVEPGHTTTR